MRTWPCLHLAWYQWGGGLRFLKAAGSHDRTLMRTCLSLISTWSHLLVLLEHSRWVLVKEGVHLPTKRLLESSLHPWLLCMLPVLRGILWSCTLQLLLAEKLCTCKATWWLDHVLAHKRVLVLPEHVLQDILTLLFWIHEKNEKVC